jgi:hypothetical protein
MAIAAGTPINSLKYIGDYLSDRFRTHSFWPPDSDTPRPILTLEQLVRFVKTRSVRDIPATRRRLTEWLDFILQNAHPGQCVGDPLYIDHEWRRYKVREQNQYGHFAIISYLRGELIGTVHYGKVPLKKPRLPVHRSHPRSCSL